LAGAFLFVLTLGPANGSADETAKVRAQLIEWYAREAPDARTVRTYVQALKPDGSWPDVDYVSKERGGWPTYRHLTRTLDMAQAYKKSGHALAGDRALKSAIVKSLGHWTEKDYVNPNWWYPRIGVPMTVAPILVLMGDDIPTNLKQRTIQRVLIRSKTGMTGQNKVWLAGIAFMKGLLNDDQDLMKQMRDQIFSELRVTTAEGVQPDYSFHQHGPQQQWGNYGAAFGSDMIRWASILRGTDYALDSEQVQVLRHYLLEGSSWILWKERMDISGCGRQIFRNCQASKGNAILRQLKLMTAIDPSKARTYEHLIGCTQADPVDTLTGHKHFWRSDISVHRRPNWYASVKMSSTRVVGAETCNSENLLGLHLGDGVTYFYRTGHEYEDLFPVWDWRRLPGTTSRQDQGSLVPATKRCRGQSDFVGGLSNGTQGIAAMEYIRDGLQARKAWFFLDEAVVCLGTGINCTAPETVLTSVNQCASNGPVTVSADQRTHQITPGKSFSGHVEWAHHDGIGYVFLDPRAVTVRAETQSGNWHAVHGRESKATVKRDVFSLWIDHGSQPRQAQYAYSVHPDTGAKDMPALCASPPIRVLQHTSSLLAISSQVRVCRSR
jgi:chondroitin AC lyase